MKEKSASVVVHGKKRTFGISFEPDWSISESIELATLVEKLGYSNIWVPDGGPAPPYSDSLVTLSAIASKTEHVKFGSAIFNFYTRNPAWIASSFLALSDLAAHKRGLQRAIVGLGVGSEYTVSKMGIHDRKGGADEMREAIESIQELFSGKTVTVRTDAFTIEGVTLSKSPKKIPIYVGSSSPMGLKLAGEIADGAILTDRNPGDIDESLNPIILGISESRRKRRELELVDSLVISLDENRSRARRLAKKTCAYLVAWQSGDKAKLRGIDLPSKEKIRRFIETGDDASAAGLVTNQMLDAYTASGNLDDCLRVCREYLEHDIDQIAFCEPFGPDRAKSITTIARQLIPRI